MPQYTTSPGVKPGKIFRWVTYYYDGAFTICDCGADMMLTEKKLHSKVYTGQCPACKKSFTLFNGQLTPNQEP